jgi:hypothetical protein
VRTWEKHEGKYSANGNGKAVDLFQGAREFAAGGSVP